MEEKNEKLDNETTVENTTIENEESSEKEVLETDVLKLQDPEYMAKYAREKYLYSKDDEIVIKLEE